MATVILRPSSEISSGSWANESASGFDVDKINDSDNATYVTNTSTNQSFYVHLDDTSGLSGATFNNFVVTVIMRKEGRSKAGTLEVEIGDGSSTTTFGSVSDTTFNTMSSSFVTINAAAINFGGSVSDSDVDDMRLTVTTTSGNQSSLAEIYVTVDYTEASGYGHDVNSVGSSSIGKVNTVATASIGKVNSVD